MIKNISVTYHIALLKVYMQEKKKSYICLSVLISFQYSNWILPKFYFSTYQILLRLYIQMHSLLCSCYLYGTLIAAVLQVAQQTASLR